MLISVFAAVVLIYGGYRLVSLTLTTSQPSPALHIEMGYVYLALPISGFFIVIFSIEMMVEKISLLLKK
jgi:TRAP-type C4-dicarboxylate transport system permease small subunit